MSDIITLATRYIYDNEDILLELDSNNQVVALYTHGPGIDEPLIMLRGGQSFFYHADGLGSIWDLIDAAGSSVRSYTYDSFGNLLGSTGSVTNPYTYTAREFDAETGLHYYRARYYDPEIGRFLQEDPIGFLGGINFYSYVGNNPVNFVDPDGEAGQIVLGVIGIALLSLGGAIAIQQQSSFEQPGSIQGFVESLRPVPLPSDIIAENEGFDENIETDEEELRKRAEELIESVGQPEQPKRFCPPPGDPGEFLRICFSNCIAFFKSFFGRATCFLRCIGAVRGGPGL